jgi:hypothetical protein
MIKKIFIGSPSEKHLKVLKAKNTIIKTFDLVPKSVRTTLINRSKVLKALFKIIKTFDLVPKYLPPDRMIFRDFRSSEKYPKI